VTPLGQEFYQECLKMIEQAEFAENFLLQQKKEPQGLVRISCPSTMMQFQIRNLLNTFLKKYSKVELDLELSSRRVDPLHDDIDLAIRTNFQANENSSLVVRDVVKTTHCLVASPSLLKGHVIQQVSELSQYPSIILNSEKQQHAWELYQPQQQHERINIQLSPRVKCNDLAGVYYAAIDGLGIAELPYLTIEEDIRKGNLVHILPEWESNLGTVQLVYASRKGQRLVMQKLIETLVDGLRDMGQNHNGYLI